MFARIFNGKTAIDSSFYVDSFIYTNSTTRYKSFRIKLQSILPIDGGDDDGDGLINSWEKSLGLDPLDDDTDGDGINDYHEYLSGTNGLDENDFLRIKFVDYLGGDLFGIEWTSVSNYMYQLQGSTNLMTENGFADIGNSIVASNEATYVLIINSNEYYFFRVRLAP